MGKVSWNASESENDRKKMAFAIMFNLEYHSHISLSIYPINPSIPANPFTLSYPPLPHHKILTSELTKYISTIHPTLQARKEHNDRAEAWEKKRKAGYEAGGWRGYIGDERGWENINGVWNRNRFPPFHYHNPPSPPPHLYTYSTTKTQS